MARNTGLGIFLNSLFDDFRINRQNLLEEKWESNYNAYNRKDDSGEDTRQKGEEWKSKRYIGLTQQKVNTGASMILDLLLQRGIFPFQLQRGEFQKIIDSQPDTPPAEIAQRELDMKEMERRIRQQLDDTKAYQSLKRNVLAGGIYGESWAKRRVIEVERTTFELEDDGQGNVIPNRGKENRLSPSWEFVSNWDIFWDIDDENIQTGRGIVHRSLVSAWDLRQMKDQPFVDNDAIDRVIESGASDNTKNVTDQGNLAPSERRVENRGNKMALREFWCRAPRKHVENFKKNQNKATEPEITDVVDDGDEVEIFVVVVMDEIIMFAEIEEGERRPFYRVEWETSVDEIGGRGIADLVEDMQKMINHGIRKFEDNKELSANVMLAIKERLVDRKDLKFRPGEYIPINEEADSVQEAIHQFIVADVGESLLSLIGLARELADEDSMIPKIQQGFTLSGTQTAFETSQLIEKATKYIAMVIKNFDEELLVPILTDFYEFNMNDESVEFGIGDYEVKVTSYDSFQAKANKSAALQQMLGTLSQVEALQGEFKMQELGKDLVLLLDMDADRYMKTDLEKQQEAQAFAQSPQGQIQALQEQLQLQLLQANIQKTQADAAKKEAEADKISDELDIEIQEKTADLNEQRLENIEAVTDNGRPRPRTPVGAGAQ